MVNLKKLHGEIAEAIAIEGIADVTAHSSPPPAWYIFQANGTVLRVDFVATPDQNALDAVQAIIDVHDPTDYVQQTQDNAEDQAAAIPEWSGWTEAEGLQWHTDNLKTLIDAVPEDVTGLELAQLKQVIQRLVDIQRAQVQLARASIRMQIALRNQAWPRLQE